MYRFMKKFLKKRRKLKLEIAKRNERLALNNTLATAKTIDNSSPVTKIDGDDSTVEIVNLDESKEAKRPKRKYKRSNNRR